MSIVRIYVRTFQIEEHADLFLLFCKKLKDECIDTNLEINLTVIQILATKIKLLVFGNIMIKNI